MFRMMIVDDNGKTVVDETGSEMIALAVGQENVRVFTTGKHPITMIEMLLLEMDAAGVDVDRSVEQWYEHADELRELREKCRLEEQQQE